MAKLSSMYPENEFHLNLQKNGLEINVAILHLKMVKRLG